MTINFLLTYVKYMYIINGPLSVRLEDLPSTARIDELEITIGTLEASREAFKTKHCQLLSSKERSKLLTVGVK